MDILIFKLYYFREMISKLTSFLTRKKGGCLSFATGYDNRHFYLRILKKLIKNETGPFMTVN